MPMVGPATEIEVREVPPASNAPPGTGATEAQAETAVAIAWGSAMTRKDENDTDPTTPKDERAGAPGERATAADDKASIENLLQGFDGRIVDPPVNARSSSGQDAVLYSAGPQSAPVKNATPVPLPPIMISRTPVPPARPESEARTVISPPRDDRENAVTVLMPEKAAEGASHRPKKLAAFLGAVAVVAIVLLGLVKRADHGEVDAATQAASASVAEPVAPPAPLPEATAVASAPPAPSSVPPASPRNQPAAPRAVAPSQKAPPAPPHPRASASPTPDTTPNLDIPRATDLWSAPRHDAP